jgi:hypothetical protein
VYSVRERVLQFGRCGIALFGDRRTLTITKAEFARALGVGRSAVGNMIFRKQIGGAALVEHGGRVMIDEEIARAQLRDRLDARQRVANGRAKIDGDAAPADDPIMVAIKAGRLKQITLANARAEQEAAERAGRFVSAADAKREMGAIAGRMVSAFEGALVELADAVAADTGRRRGTPCWPSAAHGEAYEAA